MSSKRSRSVNRSASTRSEQKENNAIEQPSISQSPSEVYINLVKDNAYKAYALLNIWLGVMLLNTLHSLHKSENKDVELFDKLTIFISGISLIHGFGSILAYGKDWSSQIYIRICIEFNYFVCYIWWVAIISNNFGFLEIEIFNAHNAAIPPSKYMRMILPFEDNFMVSIVSVVMVISSVKYHDYKALTYQLIGIVVSLSMIFYNWYTSTYSWYTSMYAWSIMFPLCSFIFHCVGLCHVNGTLFNGTLFNSNFFLLHKLVCYFLNCYLVCYEWRSCLYSSNKTNSFTPAITILVISLLTFAQLFNDISPFLSPFLSGETRKSAIESSEK